MREKVFPLATEWSSEQVEEWCELYRVNGYVTKARLSEAPQWH